MMVFALGISRPVSIMVVDSNTSYLWYIKSIMTFSSFASVICPWPMAILASGTRFWSSLYIDSIFSTLLKTKKTWPSLSISLSIASLTRLLLYSKTYVCIGYLSCGASSMTDMLLMPDKAMCMVLGIGVAESDSTSTFSLSFFIFSLSLTPNLCSSSIINRPRSLNLTSSDNSLCVPTTMSMLCVCSSSAVCFCSLLVLKRDIIAERIGYLLNLSMIVS